MIEVIGNLIGNYSPVTRTYNVISTAMRKGAAVTMVGAAGTLSLFTTNTAVPMWGVTSHAVASSATGSAEIQLTPSGTILQIDISEILAATALTATGGSATTFVDSSLENQGDNTLIGAVMQLLTVASDSTKVGTKVTLTDYTGSGGTCTFATITSLLASGDTAKFLSVSGRYFSGEYTSILDGTYADSIPLDDPSGADANNDGGGDWCRVIGTDVTGKKLHVVLCAGLDAIPVVAPGTRT